MTWNELTLSALPTSALLPDFFIILDPFFFSVHLQPTFGVWCVGVVEVASSGQSAGLPGWYPCSPKSSGSSRCFRAHLPPATLYHRYPAHTLLLPVINPQAAYLSLRRYVGLLSKV